MKTMSGLKFKEAIVLAGGFGTRLRTVLPDLPKCMAPVHGRPFVEAMLQYLWGEGIEHIVLSLGYRHQVIMEYMQKHHADKDISFVVEEEPLGTGGAISLALDATTESSVFILNGDTFFNASLKALEQFHKQHHADCSLVVRHMDDAARYGTLDVDHAHRVIAFQEKREGAQGLINGGVYLLNRDRYPLRELPKKYSFEHDFLSARLQDFRIFAQEQDAYFIDIGIPADYERAQREWAVFFPDPTRYT
jgi:D-glycero-alpha-D-manno-heptose 1-phosphate guanylyltransferase